MASNGDTQSKGYSYQDCLVEQLPDRFECKICHSLCRNGQLSQCCGHIYCMLCLEMWMSASGNRDNACPMCHRKGFKTFKHHEAIRTIDQLLVECPCRKIGRGCKWTGKLCDLDNHVNECKVECERCGVQLNYNSMHYQKLLY